MKQFTKQEETKLKQLHEQGFIRNEIARQLHRSPAAIGTYANKLGLTFDRTLTKNATKTKQADAASLRADLKLKLLHEAQKLMDDLHRPQLVYTVHTPRESTCPTMCQSLLPLMPTTS